MVGLSYIVLLWTVRASIAFIVATKFGVLLVLHVHWGPNNPAAIGHCQIKKLWILPNKALDHAELWNFNGIHLVIISIILYNSITGYYHAYRAFYDFILPIQWNLAKMVIGELKIIDTERWLL